MKAYNWIHCLLFGVTFSLSFGWRRVSVLLGGEAKNMGFSKKFEHLRAKHLQRVTEGSLDAWVTEVLGCSVTVVFWDKSEMDSDEPRTLRLSDRMSWSSGTDCEGGVDATRAEEWRAFGSGRISLLRRWGVLRLSLGVCEEGVVFVLIRPYQLATTIHIALLGDFQL